MTLNDYSDDLLSYSNPDYSWQEDVFKQKHNDIKLLHIPEEITKNMLINNISFTFLEKLDMAWLLIMVPKYLLKVFLLFINQLKDLKMSDLKTTVLV